MNETLLNILKTLPENLKSDWKSHIKKLTFTYNNTKNNTTDFSPHFLLFGRLPKDLAFDLLEKKSEKSYPEYVENWQNAMKKVLTKEMQ